MYRKLTIIRIFFLILILILIVLTFSECTTDKKMLHLLNNKIQMWENVYIKNSTKCHYDIIQIKQSIEFLGINPNNKENKFLAKIDSITAQLDKIDQDTNTLINWAMNYLEGISDSELQTIIIELKILKSKKKNPSIFDIFQESLISINNLHRELNKIKKHEGI